jgi:hypothetical protein
LSQRLDLDRIKEYILFNILYLMLLYTMAYCTTKEAR